MEVDVLVDGQRAVEGVELRHDADQLPRLRRLSDNIDAIDAYFAAAGKGARGADADGCGLAGSVWTQEAKDLALLDIQVDPIHGYDALPAFVDLGQCFNFDDQRLLALGGEM